MEKKKHLIVTLHFAAAFFYKEGSVLKNIVKSVDKEYFSVIENREKFITLTIINYYIIYKYLKLLTIAIKHFTPVKFPL